MARVYSSTTTSGCLALARKRVVENKVWTGLRYCIVAWEMPGNRLWGRGLGPGRGGRWRASDKIVGGRGGGWCRGSERLVECVPTSLSGCVPSPHPLLR